eukprot:scaffold70465_cov13-Tisochrysis_lutea.AAC.1
MEDTKGQGTGSSGGSKEQKEKGRREKTTIKNHTGSKHFRHELDILINWIDEKRVAFARNIM